MKQICILSLLPNRAFTFNSQKYFVYHDLARFVESEEANIQKKHIGNILHCLSLVSYKN